MTDREKMESIGGYFAGDAPATNAQFEARSLMLEETIGRPLPARYRAFLADCGLYALPSESMPRAFVDGDFTLMAFFGFAPGDDYNLKSNFEAVKARIPERSFPIATDPAGSLFLILGSGEIAFWEHETNSQGTNTVTLLAPDFSAFWGLF